MESDCKDLQFIEGLNFIVLNYFYKTQSNYIKKFKSGGNEKNKFNEFCADKLHKNEPLKKISISSFNTET